MGYYVGSVSGFKTGRISSQASAEQSNPNNSVDMYLQKNKSGTSVGIKPKNIKVVVNRANSTSSQKNLKSTMQNLG
jgi:hypothetical protein